MNINWREQCSNLIEEQLYMLEHEIDTDCVITVSQDWENYCPNNNETVIKVHTYILKRASPVFAEILRNKGDIRHGNIEIYNEKVSTVNRLIRCMYGEETNADISVHELVELVIAANKYGLKLLVENGLSIISNNFTGIHNVWNMCKLINSNINLPILEEIEHNTFKIIQERTKECIKLANVFECSEEDIIKIVQMDDLFLDSELELITFVDKWAKIELTKRAHEINPTNLRRLLYPRIIPSLKFLTLTNEEFYYGPDALVWLTPEEKLAILKFITTGNKDDIPCNISNCIIRRCKSYTIHFQRLITNSTNNQKIISSLVFTSDKNIVIHGIQMKSQSKFYCPVTACNEDNTQYYQESLTVGIVSLNKNGGIKKSGKRYKYEAQTYFNSIIHMWFSSPYHYKVNEEDVRNKREYYIEVKLNNTQGLYYKGPQYFNRNAKNHIIKINDVTLEFFAKKGNFVTRNPEFIKNISFTISD